MWTKFGMILCIVSIGFIGLSQETNQSYQPDAFANFLYSSDLHEFASEEYERLFFKYPDSLQYFKRLLSSYKLANRGDILRNRLQFNSIEDPELLEQYYDILIATKNTDKVKQWYQLSRHHFDEIKKDDIEFKIAIGEYDWKQAITIHDKNTLDKKYDVLTEKIKSTKFKKPVLASIMSGIIPGAGRFYAKDAKDALISILFIASTGYQAYRRFNQKGIGSVGGWIFAGISFGFYVGNIHGSNKAARYYNQKLNDQIFNYSLPIISDHTN